MSNAKNLKWHLTTDKAELVIKCIEYTIKNEPVLEPLTDSEIHELNVAKRGLLTAIGCAKESSQFSID